MDHVIRFVGPKHSVELFGIKLVGVNAESGLKLLFTLVLFFVVLFLSKILRRFARGVTKKGERTAFWVRQGIHVFTAYRR